ncbi:hypothetical protein BGZ76_009721 [Entomortierella beljakovae]|nr:hypothetical protein BGZ76_009721 [Entomortierella beljakovae]
MQMTKSSLVNPALSPPNQPRRTLSTQLAPDYHNWVNDVSSSPMNSSKQSSTSSGNRFLDAVTGRSNNSRGRARRENQPSFNGSTFTNSDNDADNNDDHEENNEHRGESSQWDSTKHNTSDIGAQSHGEQLLESSEHPDQQRRHDGSTSATKLPPLSKSRIQVPDPSRPAFKLGAPLNSKSRSQQSRSSFGADAEDTENHTETSALLGNSKLRNPDEDDTDRWTNEGSRRRTPWYNGPDSQMASEGPDRDEDGVIHGDSLRRPSRARSLSPTMEVRRRNQGNGNRVVFSHYPSSSDRRRQRNQTFQNLRRSSIANINIVKEKLLPRKRSFYDDAKEALVKENNGIRIWYHNYTTIDWIHDFVKERVRLRHLRSIGGIRGMLKSRADSLKGWVLVLLTGVITACIAALIDVSSWWLGDLRMAESCPEWIPWSKALSLDNFFLSVSNDTFDWIVYCSFGTLFAGICVVMVTSDGTLSQQRSHGSTKRRVGQGDGGMTKSASRNSMQSILNASQPKKIAYFGAGSGIPEVKTILGGFVIRGFLGFRTLMIKIIGLPLMVASGLNMGKQGPLVHIACCVGNIVCRIFDKYNRNDGKRREILSAASAAGVACAFGAPIGGVLFSLEEVSYYFPSKTMWRTYFCALVSAVVLKGVYGAIFSQFHMNYSRFRSRTWIGRHPVQEVLAVTLITCSIQWLNPWTRVNLLQLLTNLYSECTQDNNLNGMCAVEVDQIYPIFLLLAEIFVMKVFLNFITFGVKVPGGIFIPTMVAGAVFGRMVGLGVQWLIATYPESSFFQVCEGDHMDCVIPGLYAMIGAAACLSGVTRMTVSLVVIMFELTGAMTYSLPIMMAVMIGKFVGDAFSPDAFFNKLIDLNGHPYLDNKKDYNTFGTAADIADRYLETIDVNEVNDVDSLRRKVEILAASGYSDGGLPIVDRDILVGYIASNELAHALDLAEQKDPECVCIFRNRASSTVPATEIITSLGDIEARVSAQNKGQNYGLGLSASPLQDSERYDSFDGQGLRSELTGHQDRDDDEYDDDMHGHNQPVRDSYSSSLKRQSGASLESSGYDESLLGGQRFATNKSRVSSTGTTNLLRDPAHTMDFTPFTDQAPLSVSLFSSMDLVMELFIKLGIKYVCVVKAGEHYGMIHKKRLLTFLKENDERQKQQSSRLGCC